MSHQSSKLLKIGDAAELIGKNPQTLRNWEKSGYITPLRTEKGHRRYTLEQLEPFLSAKIDRIPEFKEQEVPVSLDDNHIPHILLTDFDDRRLIPIKSQIKALEHTITNFQNQDGLLILITSMLLIIIIRLFYLVSASTELVLMATELHQNYVEYISTVEIENNPEDRIVEEQQTRSQQNQEGTREENTVWQRAKQQASKVFLALSKASVDQSLDDEERKRARNVINKILAPYQRATANLAEYEPGTVQHDVAALLLFHHPTDFGINRERWSVRLLSRVCQEELDTRACKRSSVHRVLQKLRWNCATRSKMMSPDENYGQIMKRLGLLMCDLGEDDVVLFGDEFVYSTVKVAEFKKQKTAAEGLNEAPPFSLSKPFYRSVSSVLVQGLVDPSSRKLVTGIMERKNYSEFFKTLCPMVDHFRSTLSSGATIHLILDNAKYHCPEILRKQLNDRYGNKVRVTFLPTYSPHHNPIERIWQFLLRNSRRCGEDESELVTELQDAVNKFHETGNGKARPVQLHCDVCGKKWQFVRGEDQEENKRSLEKHICFQIEGINPFNIHVLKHSVEHLSRNNFAYPFT